MFRKLSDIVTDVVATLCKPCAPRPTVSILTAPPPSLEPNTTYIYPEGDSVVVKEVPSKGMGFVDRVCEPGMAVSVYAPMPVHVDLVSPRTHLLPESVQIKDHGYAYIIGGRVWVTHNCQSTTITPYEGESHV